MAYVYNSNKRGRKPSRSKTKQLELRRILASLTMAAGILAMPFSVGEAAIVRKEGTGPAIAPNGNVYNIDPEGSNGNFAYNRFKEFNLPQDQIANLKFGNAATLANLVNSKVTINGIVNAVKGGAIDGHLIFLSPNGIAVGAKGIINAGSFTGIVPTQTNFDKLYNSANPATDITLNAVNTIRDGAYANDKAIDISGQINTHSGVMLGAGIINIKDGAKIQSTKNLDFTNLVKIQGGTDAGLGTLTKVEGSGGDIILAAKQSSEVKDTKVTKGQNGQDKTEANIIHLSERSTDLSAAVNVGKNVTISGSDGAVKLTAESTSTYEDSTPMTLTSAILKDKILGEDKTILDGVVNKLAGKEAAANQSLLTNYSVKKNKSSVKIGQNSTITGKNIDIAATSKVEIEQSIAVPKSTGATDSNGRPVSNSKVVATVTVARVTNTADVVIDGNLTAKGADTEGNGIKIAANADTKVSLSATAGTGEGNAVAAGVAILAGDTKAKVTAKEGATALTAANGKVSVGSTTGSDIDVNVGAAGATSAVASTVGVVNYDTSADVILDRSITAGAVDINAENNYTGLKLTVDNTIGSSSANTGGNSTAPAADDSQQSGEGQQTDGGAAGSEQRSVDPTRVIGDASADTSNNTQDAQTRDSRTGIQNVTDRVTGTNAGGNNAQQTSAFGLGASVGVVSNKNDTNVTIGKNAVITAAPVANGPDGSVNVSAKTLMTASTAKEDALQFTVKNTLGNAKVEIGAAVLVSNVKNNATLLLDTDGTHSAQIKGDKVSLSAASGMGKYPAPPEKDGGTTGTGTGTGSNQNTGAGTGTGTGTETETEEKTSVLSYTVSAEGTSEEETPSTFALSGSVGVNTLKNNAVVLLGQKSKVEGSAVTLSSDAVTGAEGTYGANESETKVGIGASVGIQNIRGNSLVMAGKGVQLTGTESLEASANNEMDLKNSVQNAGKGNSVGVSGMVALSFGDSNSIVSLDDEAAISAGFATLSSMNSTNVENSARTESNGNAGAKAFGIGVGIVNYDVNSIAMVADNGSGISAPSGNTTDEEKAAQKIYGDAKLARDVAGSTLAGKLGSKTAAGTKGSITTGGLVGTAVTTGMIQNDAKANANAVPKENNSEEGNNNNANGNQNSDNWTQWTEQGREGANEAGTTTQNLEEDNVTSQNESGAPNASGAGREASQAANPDATSSNPTEVTPTNAGASIGIAGSAALTFLGGRTDAVLDNVTVNSGTAEEPAPVAAVSLSATDFLGSITIGGTGVKNKLEEGGSGTKVGIGGTFAMNSSKRDVDSLIRNADLPMALMVSNSATKIGIEVAAGMGTSTGDGDGTNVNGAGVVYYNRAKQDVHALMINDDVMGASVSNQATNTDFQIAGGLAGTKGSGANTSVGVGGAVAISNLENNLSSAIIGGNYTVLSSVDVEAQKGTTQINGALAGTKGSYGFEGAFAYGSVKNNTHAYISGATVTGLDGSAVNVKAGEVPVITTNTQLNEEKTKVDNNIDKSIDSNPNKIDTKHNYTQLNSGTKQQIKTDLKKQANDALDKEAETQKTNEKTLKDEGFDTTGSSYLDKSSNVTSSLNDDASNTDAGAAAGDAAGDENDAKDELGQNHSITITAAMGGGWNGNAGAGAGISYNYVKNDIATDIKDSTIAADTVNGEAVSDSLIVSVGAGVAVGGKSFNGAGSGSWNDLKNDTKVTFENNTIAGKNISEQAQTTGSIINIAGEVAGGKGMAMGLSLAYNSLNNTTGTYLTGNTIVLSDVASVNLATTNLSKALAVAGGVDVNISQSFAGAVGTVAINRGVSNTESVIDGKKDGTNTTLDDLQSLSVTAEELTKKTTVAGGISVGGKKVGIGGAVAYSAIGSSGNKERLRAEINHADVTTTKNGTITVAAKDGRINDKKELERSRITTVGAGIGVGWGKNYFNFQGAAAVSDNYKDSRAFLDNTSINADKEHAGNHPAINVTADTKSKINTVGAVGNISITGKVTGTVGIAINRMDQDTKAEMATDNGKTTAVNAGFTQVRATGDGDIHSVGVGATVSVGEFVTAAGSGSHNYIGNDVDAIIKNQNLKANGSVGVVAQSDDRLYNFAGGFNIGANTRAALGAAASTNKITGSTNALVSGGSVSAADSGSVKVSRPKDDKIFKAEQLNVAVARDGLSSSRTEESKTGIVVDSSAAHTIISQLSSGGVAASSTVGVNLSGTVNLNTIEGQTTAKIKDTHLNSSGSYSNINVNAVDYTNFGSFTGTPAVGAGAALGVSFGVSANWETYDRTTEAEISSTSAKAKKNVYAKNLTVDATAKHGSSALSFAAAASGAKIGIASGDSIMRHKYTGTINAKLDKVNAVFDGKAEIKAEHLGNSHTQNISASLAAGMIAVSAGAGVSVMDNTTTVKAEVADSSLQAKSTGSGKDISVLAKNENNWKNTLVTASLGAGIGAGLAANVGIFNTTGETAALVTNSDLKAYNVNVNATDRLTAHGTGGVGAGGVGGVGVAVTLHNINSSVSAHVTGGTVTASNNIDVKAEETRNFDSQVTGVGAGGIGVGVNVAVTSINKGITDAQLSNAKDENNNPTSVSADTQNEIKKHLNGYDTKDDKGNKVHVSGVNEANGLLGDSDAKFYGLKSAEKDDLKAAKNTTVSLATPTYDEGTPDTRKMGIHTEVSSTILKAGNNVNVTAKETSDIYAKNVGVTAAGAASINVTDAIIHTNYDTDVTMNKATVTAKNVNINALQTQAKDGSSVKVTAVTVGALASVGVGYAGIVNRGAADIDITNSTINSTGNVTVSAKDESKHRSDILSVGVAALNVTTTFASVENYSNVGVTLDGKNDISATGNVAIDAKKANALEAHTQGVGVGGINVAVNHATIEDGEKDKDSGKIVKGNATAKITGTNGTFTANSFHLGAANDTTAKLSAGNVAVSVLGVSRMRGKGVMDMGAEVDVAGGAFNAKTVEFTSMLGNANGRTIEGNVKGHNISVGAVAPDLVTLTTDATGKVNVANSTFGENTSLILDNESYVDRKAYIYDVTAGGVAVGNSSADIYGKETLESTLTGKADMTNKLSKLQVATYGENTGKALADAGGGGLVGYVGAHVDNKSTNNVSSTLVGKWETTGEVYVVAAQKDETRLTAKEGHGGVIGVGGTSVDNTIKTTANATVADGTEITADRVHVGTGNSVTTGAYDDVDNKGNKDAQTYTLQDHFGGVISGNRLRSLLDITENGTVTIGKNAKITTNKLQEFIAASQNDLTNHASAKGGGAVGVVDAVTENILTINNRVNVNSGAILSNEKSASTEDIILAAYDEHKLKSHAEATVGGVAGVMVSKNLTTMNRTSEVDVAGNIESSSNVGLYAGADDDGVLSNLNVDLKAGVYNYTAIPVSSPTVRYNKDGDDKAIGADDGMVAVSGTVRSTKDINVIASGGKENVVTDESKWAWVNGGKEINKKFLSSNAVSTEEAMPKTSTVNVTGALIAGNADPINVTIKGSVAEGLSVEIPDELAESKANLRVKNGITQGTFDYANTLNARLTELKKLIAAYEGDETKMAAYIAERTRIQNKMSDMGLSNDSNCPVYYVEIPDIAASGGNINVQASDFTGTGILEANSAPSITITNESDAYLKLNNILMGEKGGQIIYNIDNVIPPGPEKGNAEINKFNVQTNGAAFSKINGTTESTAAGLQVLNTKTFSGGKTSTIKLTSKLEQEIDNSDLTNAEKTQYKKDISDGKFKYTAITDVEVNGKISNFHGNVTINNASGDIRISSGTTARPTGVEGNTVTLVAANGTIAQDYKEGIVNINGDPEKYLATQAANMKKALGLSDTSTESKSKTENYSRTDSSQMATGYIAGRDVYVSASNINVNGLIQSGYKSYNAEVTDAQLAAAKTRPASKSVVVQNRTMYKVNDGGAKWNATDKVFDYVPQVYWDPSTEKLVVEDIETAGGKVYLTGMIASTGQGKILAADGAAEISVVNNTALDMNMGNVLNNQRVGSITIADTAKNTWTEYKKGQTRTITDYSTYLANLKKHPEWVDPYDGAQKSDNDLSTTKTMSYTVKGGQSYSWISGNSVETNQTFEHYVRKGLWGAIETVNETQLKEMAKTKAPIEKNEAARLQLPEGAVISQGSNNLASGKLQLDGSARVLSSEILERSHEEWRSGFLGWFKHTRDRWKTGTKTIQLFNYTLNASQPITIGLIGAEKGSINIESKNTAGGSINLTGNVANSHNEATLNISSKAGGITQFDNTTLKSEIVNLTAKNDIKNIHLASVGTAVKDANGKVTSVTDNIKLSAVSTGNGDIDVTAVGGILENQSLRGNVTIVALKSQDGNVGFKNDAALGDVTLNAAGNITQSGSGTTVEGRGINLTSKEGGIGSAGQAVNIAGSDLVYSTDRYGAQVNAGAKGSIYLTEAAAGGDMRVGKIESKEGDVTLTITNGGFIDGLQRDDKSGSLDSVDEMVHRWIDAGVIDGEKDAKGNYTYKGAYIEGLEKSRDEYKANVEAAYDVANGGKTQAEWKAEYDDRQTVVKGIYASAEYRVYLIDKAKYDKLTPAQCRTLADNGDKDFLSYSEKAEKYSQYANYATADAYLKDTAAYKYSQYADANAYLANDVTYKDLVAKAAHPTFEWTKDMMLYAVSDALVNKASGSSAQTKGAANVLGKNITLKAAKGGVGSLSDTTTRISVEDLTGNKQIENMKKLMNVDASDVTAVRDANNNLLAFEIKGNLPLGIRATGTLNVEAGGNVSVAGRKDATEHSAIKVGTINATNNSAKGNVRLYSEKGIYNATNVNTTNIRANNLTLAGGKESIGEENKPLTVSLTGDLTEARADKDVFIKNMNNNDYLRLGAMFAGNTISVTSEKGFKMSSANSGIAESYIQAGKKLVFDTNKTTGIVGEAGNAIRILNDRAPVNIEAGSAYIRGVHNGTLVLGNIDTKGEFVAESDDKLSVGREEEKNSAGMVEKEAVKGSVKTGGNATLSAASSLTLDGTVTVGDLQNAKKTLTLKAVSGNITQTDKGVITADTVQTFNGKSLLLENTNNQFNNITVDGITTDKGEKPAIDGSVRIKDNAGALTVAVNRNVTGDISVENLRANGTLTNKGNLTATDNIDLTAKGNLTQGANTTLTAGKNVALTSASAGITQNATAGIRAQKVTAVSAKSVDLQGAGNQFSVLAVQGANGNAAIQGSVLVLDSADKLELSIQPVINGNITVENKKAKGVLQVSSELQAKGNGTDAKGDISLKSDGSLQNNRKIAAANDVKLTSISGDVSINGDISTGNKEPEKLDPNNPVLLEGTYNELMVHAGGAIQEAADVKIDTPVVETYSGKGVSMESTNNTFGYFLADALEGSSLIDGSVKAVSNYAGGEDKIFTAGLGASVRGDAEFTNIHPDGGLGLLIWHPDDENREVQVLGGNGAQGSLILKSSQDVGLLGNANAAQDIVIEAADGAFFGLGRNMVAGNDVRVTVGEGVYYVGATIHAGHDIDMQALKPASLKENSGIYIGALPNNIEVTDSSAVGKLTALTADNKVHFAVNGNGNIGLEGNVTAIAGDVVADISGEGSVVITKSVASENGSVSLKTEKGDIFIGTDNVKDDMTVSAKKNVTIETDPGTIYILGKTITETGDITMTAGKDKYEEGTANGNFIIRDDGKLISGGGINLNGRNGDIHITDDIQARKGINATIKEKGSVIFDRDVNVTNDLSISTDEGNISIGKAINSTEGTVSLQTKNGDILVGQDITAGKDVAISTQDGNIVVGDTKSGNDGDILSKNGNVSIRTDKGSVGIVKTVTAEKGSIEISSGDGDILIGNNGPDVKTVSAYKDVSLLAEKGKITVSGKTSAETGDATLLAGNETYVAGEAGQNIIIDHYGEVKAGNDATVIVVNGDIHMTDKITAGHDFNFETREQGDILVDKDIAVVNDMSMKTENGKVVVGKDDGTGKIVAGGDVQIETKNGDATVKTSITSTGGSVSMDLDHGNIKVGEVKTENAILAKNDINLKVADGTITVNGTTKTQEGSITVEALDDATNGTAAKNIVITHDGKLDSGLDLTLHTSNGGINVTDDTLAKQNLTVTVDNVGDVNFERNVDVTGNVVAKTGTGNITIGKTITTGQDVTMTAGTGDILVGEDVTAGGKVKLDVTTSGNVIVGEADGTGKITAAGAVDIATKNGGTTVKTSITSTGDSVSVKAEQGNIYVGEVDTSKAILAKERNGWRHHCERYDQDPKWRYYCRSAG
ncbi:hypothetical protein [uncultured Succiniclasticum sp.]|uniref:hypothetical protein n=1 Tax=uncultured Succiniclasticum sp. TaxID=1500547 RepID=UPI0025F46739|nr:hypothetical protein [uncultured Succiniclasticum sp.]